MVITLSEEAAGEDIRLSFQEILTGTAPDLPAGYAHPVRMFRVTALGLGARHNPAPYPATINVLLTEQDLEVAGGDPYRLVVKRYDETASAWKSTATSVDLPWLRIETTTDALGLFATMSAFEDEGQGERQAEDGAGLNEKAEYELAGIRHLMAETVATFARHSSACVVTCRDSQPATCGSISTRANADTDANPHSNLPTPKPTPTPTLTPDSLAVSIGRARRYRDISAATAALIPTLAPSTQKCCYSNANTYRNFHTHADAAAHSYPHADSYRPLCPLLPRPRPSQVTGCSSMADRFFPVT